MSKQRSSIKYRKRHQPPKPQTVITQRMLERLANDLVRSGTCSPMILDRFGGVPS